MRKSNAWTELYEQAEVRDFIESLLKEWDVKKRFQEWMEIRDLIEARYQEWMENREGRR